MPERKQSLEKALPKLHECEVLLNYALSQGKKLPNNLIRTIKGEKNKALQAEEQGQNLSRSVNDGALSGVYAELVRSIAPASPSAVLLMEQSKRSWFRFLGPIPLVRKMMLVTIVSLVTFLSLFLSSSVDSISINQDILSFQDPIKFVLNELVIVSIAALGASFYGLFEAYKFISNTSFDEKYESIYWIRFVLGIVSGVILAQFIFISGIDPNAVVQTVSEGQVNRAPVGSLDFITYKPLLAFLGGFSSRVVHKILNSLVDSVETFVSGSARDAIRAREEAAKAQIEERVKGIQRDSANRDQAMRLQSTLQLLDLQQKLAKGELNTQDTEKRLQGMIDQLVSSLSAGTGTAPSPSQGQDSPPPSHFEDSQQGQQAFDDPFGPVGNDPFAPDPFSSPVVDNPFAGTQGGPNINPFGNDKDLNLDEELDRK